MTKTEEMDFINDVLKSVGMQRAKNKESMIHAECGANGEGRVEVSGTIPALIAMSVEIVNRVYALLEEKIPDELLK